VAHSFRPRKIWEKDAEDGNVSAKGLVDRSTLVDISWSYLNRPTEIDLNPDFLVIDISGIKDTLKDPMNFLVTALMSLRFKTRVKKETIIAIDEGSVFLKNAKLLDFLITTWKMGRSYKIAGWIATQEPGDLEAEGVANMFKMNTFINVVFGNNLTDKNMDSVARFYHLTAQEQALLKGCTKGQGLLMIGDSNTPLYVRPTDYEWECIKGKKPQKASIDVDIPLKNPALNDLALENGIYFDDWIDGSSAPLANAGFIAKRVQDTFGVGTIRAWIKSDILGAGDMIGNQSLPHYTTVLRVAGYLIQEGVKAKVNHQDDVDIATEFKSGKVAFEIEMPGTHTLSQLVAKKEFAENKYGEVYFIGTQENLDDLATVAGKNAVQRSTTLKELINSLVKENEVSNKPEVKT
jgi:hypothetical protein